MGRLIDITRLTLLCGLSLSSGAVAQGVDCARLQAAIAAPVRANPAAAGAAQKVRADLDKLSGYSHSIGCDNQQFLFFGQAPPPQCGGLKARISGLRAQYDALMARAQGDDGQKRDLIARYNASCRENAAPPREKGFFETLFGGGSRDSQSDQDASQAPIPGDAPLDGLGGDGAHGGGSQALCVRSCDGGFFPLPVSSHSASSDQLLELCKALCPNAEVQLFSRVPGRDIGASVSMIDGSAYEDLPNAMKYAKTFDPACGCKPPHQSWVEALAHAEQLLDDMGVARASDAAITEQQARAMSQPLAVRQLSGRSKGASVVPAPPSVVLSPDAVAKIAPAKIAPAKIAPDKIAPPAKPETRTVESQGPDGAPRQVRVIGPNL